MKTDNLQVKTLVGINADGGVKLVNLGVPQA